MECENQPPPSVIEMLMGLSTQPVRKTRQERVLSDNYLQKTSSLRSSCKSLPSRTCSSATAMQVDATDLVPTMRFLEQFCNDGYEICRSDSMLRSSLWDSRDTSLHPRHPREIKSQNRPELLETNLRHNAVKSQQKQKQKHILFKPSKGRFSVKKSKGPEQDFISENVTNKLDARKNSDSSISFLSSNRIRKEETLRSHVPSKGNWIMTHRSLIRPRTHWDTNWHLVSEEAARGTPDTRLFITECNSEPLSTNTESSLSMISESECVKVCPSSKYKIRRCDQNVLDGSNGVYGSSLDRSSCLGFSRLKDCETGLGSQTLETQNDLTYDYNGTQLEHLIGDAHDIFQEASESLSDLASCPTPEPQSPTSSESEEVSRCSPISVLESISKGGVPSTMDCFMNGGTDLYEVYSEGLGMTVSSDEENREESTDPIPIEDNTELTDRSYLVSVLGEACGFGYVNYTKWNSFENPVNSPVFQFLEEKYGRNLSWPRSERKLLFDRINTGLSDTARTCFSIRQISASLRQKFIFYWTRKEVEENLWKLLITDETKTNDIRHFKNKKSTAKKGKKSNAITCNGIMISEGDFSFLELEDYMDEIIIDIERSLLDDLVFEILSVYKTSEVSEGITTLGITGL